MRTVKIRKHGPGGYYEEIERGGGVFHPLIEDRIGYPVYSMGFPDTREKEPIFTCPVSAIPAVAWDMLILWWGCRSFGALPFPGAWLDQPLMVRKAFPVLEAEHRLLETTRQGQMIGSAFTHSLMSLSRR